ncbi:hypothetical protein AAGX25_13900, partial [Staphylococcus aureus]
MSVRGINKVKRELGFVLMALNIRKIAAQRAVHYKIHIKKADFYQIINRNQLFLKPKLIKSFLNQKRKKSIVKEKLM